MTHDLARGLVLTAALLTTVRAHADAQMPFATDDAAVTPKGGVHFESFDEFDWLQPARTPHLRQNTINGKLNYGLGHGLELDLDAPLITIYNDFQTAPRSPFGIGDTELGVKWNFRQEDADSVAPGGPALAAVFYVEIPTGDPSTGIGSGLTDTWFYFVAQKALGRQLTLRANAGYLVTGNPATGVVGLTASGHVATMSASLTRRFSQKLNLGAEVAGAVTNSVARDRAQLQAMFGGSYTLREGLAVAFGLIGGHFAASPRSGLQIGFSLDR